MVHVKTRRVQDKVLLCAAAASPNWRHIPCCVLVISQLLQMMSRRGFRWPICAEAGTALALAPKVLLLDEPLSALDARIRAKLRQELRGLVRRLGLTAIYVTHDQDEVLALSDRVAVMRAGRIEQIDTPRTIYQSPVSDFVGRFVGVSTVIAGRVGLTGDVLEGLPWPLPLAHVMLHRRVPPCNARTGRSTKPEKAWVPGSLAVFGTSPCRCCAPPSCWAVSLSSLTD
jgi:hypothetical protein